MLRVRGIHAEYDDIEVRGPRYQAPNVACAIAATEAVLGRPLEPEAVRRGIRSAVVPGRFEPVLSDLPLLIDASHNPQAAEVLASAIAEAWPDDARRPHILLAVLGDKDAEGIVRALAPVAGGFVVTASASPRALPAEDLAGIVEAVTATRPAVAPSVEDGMHLLLGAENGAIVTGSITTAGEARAIARQIRQTP